MFQLKDDLLPFMSAEEIRKTVRTLAKQISSDYAGREIVLITPLKGSIHFCADLAREIQVPLKIEFVLLQTIQDRSEGLDELLSGSPKLPKNDFSNASIKIVKDINMNLSGKHVLIVEEIVDHGRSLSFLRDRLLNADPASVKIVTLLDKPSRRELPLRPDYIGKTIDDRFVVGYGLDSEEKGRNYPDLYFLKN